MFYLKYRPQKFSELFGLENVANVLRNQLKKDQVGHAYLFYGPRGTGKTTMARLLARAVNCERYRPPSTPGVGERDSRSLSDAWDGEPCNECAACRAGQAGRFLDIIEIDAASHGLVDDIRDLRDKINLAPASGKYKVYILDEAQMLMTSAANALLKTLEEPPRHALFILCTTELQKIPETIKSRCQQFEFKRAGSRDLRRKLEFIAEKEGAGVKEEILDRIIRRAQGGFRDAETLLEQFLAGEGETAGGGDGAGGNTAAFLQRLCLPDPKEAVRFLQELYEGGQNLGEFVRDTLYYLRDLLLLKLGLPEELESRSEAEIEEMNKIVAHYEQKSLITLIEMLEKAGQQLRWSPVPQLPLELLVWEWAESNRSNISNASNRGGKTEDEGQKTEGRKEITVDEEKWRAILRAVKPLNHSLEALLRSAKPRNFGKDKVEIEVFYPFHLERLQERHNQELLEQAVAEALGRKVKVVCRLANGKE